MSLSRGGNDGVNAHGRRVNAVKIFPLDFYFGSNSVENTLFPTLPANFDRIALS